MSLSDKVSRKVLDLKPSGIRKFFDIAAEMTDVISLGIGEPDYPTPWHVRDAGIYSLEQGFTKYTPNAGFTELRNQISAYLERRMDLSYDPKREILVTVGGSEAIDLSFRALIEPGDEVIIPEPSFVCYVPLVTMAGGKPVTVETRAEDGFRLTPAVLEAAITDKTKILLLPYPCNPTGGVMPKDALEAIAPIIEAHDLIVVSDEIYAELTYVGHHTSIANIPGMKERTVYIGGFSKSYSMTGWRLGYACAPEAVIKPMTRIHQFGIMSAPTTAQYAAIEALKNGDEDIDSMREDYNNRRNFTVQRLNEMGLTCFEPNGAFYAFPSIQATGLTSEEFCTRLLREEHVAVIPGNSFGDCGEGFVRCCYATSTNDLIEAFNRMERFVAKLK